MLKQLPSSKKYSIRTPNESFIIGGTGFQYGEMLRGYPDPSSGGNNVIGNYMMKYSMELRLSLSENPALYTLAFAEMGNAWLESNLLDPFDMKRSAGVGVRVFIPMLGMLGYDIGYGFDEWGTNEPFGWKHHLIFGMPF
jgi:outer membrane protein insertion porin family